MTPKKAKSEPITYGELKKQLDDEIKLLQGLAASIASKNDAVEVPLDEITALKALYNEPSPEDFEPVSRTGRARVTC